MTDLVIDNGINYLWQAGLLVLRASVTGCATLVTGALTEKVLSAGGRGGEHCACSLLPTRWVLLLVHVSGLWA